MNRKTVQVLLLGLLFAGAETAGSSARLRKPREYAEFERAAIMIPVPEVQQPDNQTCGVAALMSILSYYGVGTDDYDELKKCLRVKKNGADYREMIRYARRVRLQAEAKEGMTLVQLEDCLKARRPVIVSIQAYEDCREAIPEVYYGENTNGHFVVAIGFDQKNLYFMDPSLTGRRGYLPKREFLKRWHDNEGTERRPNVIEHLGLVIYKEGEGSAYARRAKRIE
jgi:predicted double-glycine peptidase